MSSNGFTNFLGALGQLQIAAAASVEAAASVAAFLPLASCDPTWSDAAVEIETELAPTAVRLASVTVALVTLLVT